MTERYLTAAQVAEWLGFAAGTIVDWAERGLIPSFKMGGRLRFRESEVEAWIETKRLGGAGTGGAVSANPFQIPARGVSLGVSANPR